MIIFTDRLWNVYDTDMDQFKVCIEIINVG